MVFVVCVTALAFALGVLWYAACGRRPDLVEVIRYDLRRDPGDGPLVQLEADLFADDLERMPSALGP